MIDVYCPLSDDWDHHRYDDQTGLESLWEIRDAQEEYWNADVVPEVLDVSGNAQLDPEELLTFSFASFGPNLENHVIIGPHRQPYLYITTDSRWPALTMFKDVRGNLAAYIEWHDHPVVGIQDVISKCRVTDWLTPSTDKQSRTMFYKDSSYTWSPKNMCFDLYSTDDKSTPKFLARVSKGRNTIFLDITGEAFNMGLLDAAIVATFLLHCNVKID